MATQTQTRWSWIKEQDLMARLIAAQNHPGNINRDVMTFAGFCDDRAELERHVVSCEQSVSQWDALHPASA